MKDQLVLIILTKLKNTRIMSIALLIAILFTDSLAFNILDSRIPIIQGSTSHYLTSYAYAQEYDINQHGRECVEKLGPIKHFSCIKDGDIIPITLNGREIPAGQHNSETKCDYPPLLGVGDNGRCVPYARVGRLTGMKANGEPDPDVEWAFICRRYKILPREDNIFQDVAIVGHRKSTGATCFFQMLDDEGKSTVRVPPPDEIDLPDNVAISALTAKEFWLSPQVTASITCNSCHNTDPWIHTPYIDQVCKKKADSPNDCEVVAGKPVPIVPAGPRKDLSEVGKYWFVGTQAFSEWPKPKHVALPGNLCVKCHRIGIHIQSSDYNYCSTFLDDSAGKFIRFTSESHRAPHLNYWMPPDPETMPSPDDSDAWLSVWEFRYKDSFEKIRSCCENPTNDCNLKPITSDLE